MRQCLFPHHSAVLSILGVAYRQGKRPEDRQQIEKKKDYPKDQRRTLALFYHFRQNRAFYVTYILKHQCRKESKEAMG